MQNTDPKSKQFIRSWGVISYEWKHLNWTSDETVNKLVDEGWELFSERTFGSNPPYWAVVMRKVK